MLDDAECPICTGEAAALLEEPALTLDPCDSCRRAQTLALARLIAGGNSHVQKHVIRWGGLELDEDVVDDAVDLAFDDQPY